LPSILYAVLRSMMDTTIRTEEDLTGRYDLPVLGTIPMITPSDDINTAGAEGGVSK
jgi:capsular polysaccharide biosynthesis protein